MKYDAVIFDLFGTLIDFLTIEEYLEWDGRMADALGAPLADFRRVWLAGLQDRNAGRFPSIEEELEDACRLLGIAPKPVSFVAVKQIRLDMHRRNLEPKRHALETLSALKSKGVKICLLSDCQAEVPALWPQTPFAELMDSAVFSCEERLTKPAPRLYEVACERLGMSPGQCLYIGDGGGSELAGAVTSGMSAVLLRTNYGDAFDRYQSEAKVWDGPAIGDLREVLHLVNGTPDTP